MKKGEFVELYAGEDGDYRWRRKSANGEILSESSEGYGDKDYALQEAKDNNRNEAGEPLEVRDLEITGD